MKLYTGFSPNGTRVTAFLAEKEIDLPIEPVNVAAGETRTEAFLKINPLGQIPVLELDDGRILTETMAICRYLEHLHPENPLMGGTGDEAAFIEMWNRRMELLLFNAAGDVVVHSHEMFRPMLTQIPEFAAKRQADLNNRCVVALVALNNTLCPPAVHHVKNACETDEEDPRAVVVEHPDRAEQHDEAK